MTPLPKGLSGRAEVVSFSNCVLLPTSAHACLLRAITFHNEAHQSCSLARARPPIRSFSLLLLSSFFFLRPSITYENERTNERPSEPSRGEVSSLSKRRNHSSANAPPSGIPLSPCFALVLQTKIRICTSIVGEREGGITKNN